MSTLKSALRLLLTLYISVILLSPLAFAGSPIDSNGTNDDSFAIDYDDSSTGTISLQFGTTLGKYIQYNTSSNLFEINDSIEIEGSLSVANDTNGADAQGTLNLGRKNSEWQTIEWDTGNSRFEFSNDTFVAGGLEISNDLDLNLKQLVEARIENNSTAPACSSGYEGRVYYNTTDEDIYYCDGEHWIQMISGWHGSKSTIKIVPQDFIQYGENDALGAIESHGSRVLQQGGSEGIIGTFYVPEGFQATHTTIYTSDSSNSITVYECNIGIDGCTLIGTGGPNTPIDHTDITSTNTNYVTIIIDEGEGHAGEYLYGGSITIEAL